MSFLQVSFNKMDHGVIHQKLCSIGIRGQIFNVLQSYITGSTQKVRVMNELSNEFKMSSGVPQGSLLSPLLFLFFINNLPDICNQMIPLLVADDAKFLISGLKSEHIQHDLNQMFEWTASNNLPPTSKNMHILPSQIDSTSFFSEKNSLPLRIIKMTLVLLYHVIQNGACLSIKSVLNQ